MLWRMAISNPWWEGYPGLAMLDESTTIQLEYSACIYKVRLVTPDQITSHFSVTSFAAFISPLNA